MSDTRTNWGVVALAVGAGIAIAFQIGKLPSSIPVLREELGISLVTAGWVVSLIYGVSAAIGLFAGAVADLAGARRVVIGGVVCVGFASLAGGFAPDGATLLITRFVEGLGAVTVFIATPVVIYRAAAPRDMRIAFGIWGTYMPAGVAIMLCLTPVLLSAIGWRGIWFVNGGILIAFALWLYLGTRGVPDPPRNRDASAFATLRADVGAVARVRGVWLLAGCFGAYSFNFLCVSAFLPTFLAEDRGFAPDWAAVLTALVVAANAFGNLFGGGLLHKGAPRWLLIALASAIMGTSAWILYQPWSPDGASVALAFLFTFAGGMLPASVLGGAPVHAPGPRQVGATNGLIMQGVNLGQVSGPPLFAAVVVAGGWQAGPWLTVAMAAFGVAAAVGVGRAEKRLATRAA